MAAASAAGRRFSSLLLAAVSTAAFTFAVPAVLSPAPSFGQEIQQPEVENAKSAFLGQINSNAVYVRSGPSENFYPTVKLDKGTPVTVVGIKYNWLKIEPPKGSFSYVGKAFVQRHGAGSDGVVDPVASPNVRAGSDLNAMKTTVQTKLQPGQHVKIVGEQDEYFKIEPPAGAYLYVDAKFVDAVKKLNETVAEKTSKPSQPKGGADDAAPPAVPAVGEGTSVAGAGEPKNPDSPATGPATRNDTEALANGGPTTKPSAGAETTSPVALTAKLEELEVKFKEASGKPLVDQPLEELTAGYTSVSTQPNLTKQIRRVVDARLAALKVRTEARESYLVLKKNQADVETKRQALAAEREELQERIKQNEVKVYTAVGTLRTSSLQLGSGGGMLYRLTDPATGRTVVYLRSADQSVTSLINRFIGVKGDLANDPALNLKVINNPSGAEVVDQTKVNGTVAAQVIPPSLLPKINTASTGSSTGEAVEPQ
jgi:uncharacterized protein YgiM (DUF1202 family)